jgi:hypothetical protein
MHFQNVYWDVGLMKNDGHQPSILAIGDSWFWYPFPGGSLLNHLGPIVATREHVIVAYGYNGAEAFDYVHGKYEKQIRTALKLYGDRLSAVFISGGGNDFAGLNDLRPMLLEDCSKCTSPTGCFRPADESGSLGWLLNKVKQSYITLIDQVIGATWTTGLAGADGRPASATGATKIILHNYDYAPVTGAGLFGRHSSSWLLPSFAAAKVAPEFQDDCIRYLIDEFTIVLQLIVDRYLGLVFLVDSRNALTRSDWANELHPTQAGFKKIARRWLLVLQAQGLAG